MGEIRCRYCGKVIIFELNEGYRHASDEGKIEPLRCDGVWFINLTPNSPPSTYAEPFTKQDYLNKFKETWKQQMS